MLKCVIIDDDKMMRTVLSQFISKHAGLKLTGEFEGALDAIAFLKKEKTDIIFLDLEMPEFSGKDFLETYGHELENVIITTSHLQYAVKAFEFNVSGYLTKPFSLADFSKAVKKIEDKLAKQKGKTLSESETIFVKKGSSIKKIKLSDIYLIECIGDYVTLYTDKEKFTLHTTMKAMEEKFPAEHYLRIHRSFIVRIDRIDEIEDDTVSFGSKIVPIGKTYKQEVLNKLNLF
jgi:two-component system, LytTR family, response regulator